MKTAIAVAGILTLLVSAVPADKEKERSLEARLSSEDPRERAVGARSALEKRAASVRAAMAVVKRFAPDPERGGTARDAMRLLGEMRAAEAIPVLVEHMTVSVFYKSSKRPQVPDDAYPAVGALVDIGLPSIEPVVAKAVGSDDPKVTRCAGVVVRLALGDAIARAYVKMRIDAEGDKIKKRRLEKLAAMLGELKKTYRPAGFAGKSRTRH